MLKRFFALETQGFSQFVQFLILDNIVLEMLTNYFKNVLKNVNCILNRYWL